MKKDPSNRHDGPPEGDSSVAPTLEADSSASADEPSAGRFLPGTILDRRYRIVALLGRGGMGEVYRADDIKLGQAVALKFLPPAAERNRSAVERLLGEVKIARRISHSNVCRVYDVGEEEGHTFISMEHIDGEDLASLLRRIGRLPEEKALQIARQLCAGLHAAHELGVLHRDLKPANVMLDPRGQVRIMDFGLAGLAQSFHGGEVRSGTPAYMAPEQLAGREVSVRSEIYSLGLLLYELFTGRQAYPSTPGSSPADRLESRPAPPSGHVSGLDPAVERVILRCLEPEPRERPTSALQVAAALPGRDPLAAALAAGETPSPELVADAVSSGALRPPVASLLLAGCLAGAGAVAWLAPRTQISGIADLDKPPAALVERARQIITAQGYGGRDPVDRTSGLRLMDDYLDWVEQQRGQQGPEVEVAVDPAEVLQFWYRESDHYLESFSVGGFTRFIDPPLDRPGMVRVVLRTDGRLVSFEAIPPREETRPTSGEVDWQPLFEASGLEPDRFEAVTPGRVPEMYAEHRFAWQRVPESGARARDALRVEAAASQGRPVSFVVSAPWHRKLPRSVSELLPATASSLLTGGLAVFLAIIIAAVVVARRNLRLRRGDRTGAVRLSILFGSLSLASLLTFTHHVPTVGWASSMIFVVGLPVAIAVFVWLAYIAIEPYLRRFWPEILISWVRTIQGRFKDPRVGRDVLIGCAGGLGLRLTAQAAVLGLGTRGMEADWMVEILALESTPGFLSVLADSIGALGMVLGLAVVLPVVSGLTSGRRWPAAVALFLLTAFALTGTIVGALPTFAAAALLTFLLFRFGLLTAAVSWGVLALTRLPLTLDPDAWYVGGSVLVLALILGLAAYGFVTALAGQPLLRDDLAGEAEATP